MNGARPLRKIEEFQRRIEGGEEIPVAEIRTELLLVLAQVDDPILREYILGWSNNMAIAASNAAYARLRRFLEASAKTPTDHEAPL